MKKINISKLAVIALIAVGTVFVTGCSKEVGEETVMPGEGTRVVISVGGINEGNSGSFNKVQASAGKSAASAASNGGVIEGNGFDVLITRPSSSVANLGFKDKIRAAASGADALKAETPMPSGNEYRVFLRKQGETALTSVGLKSGTPGSLAVDKGASYEWFAVSYNSTTAIPEPTSGTDIELSDLESLLYAKGEFDVADEEGDVVVPLAVVFKPRVTRAVIELNTRGMFAPIASATVTVEGLYAAPEAIDVVTGNLVGGGNSQTIAFSEFVEVPNTNGLRRVATAVVGGNADEDITVSVSNLNITLDTDGNRNFGNAELTQTFAPEAGMEQNIVLNFLETPLTRSNVGWARSNLYYSTGEYSPYRFFHTNPQTNAENTYFSFKGHLPRSLASANEANQKDPCALVYPAGRWKTPTQAELGTLTSTQGLLSNVLGGILATLGLGQTPGMQYVTGEYLQANPAYGSAPTTGQNAAYGENTSATNNIRFNYNGLMVSVAAVETLIDLNLGDTYGGQAAFWTSQSVTDANLGGLLGGVVELGAWSFIGRDVSTLLGRRVYGTQSLGVLNIDLLGGVNLVSSSLMNVRCTRNTAWDPTVADYNPEPVL